LNILHILTRHNQVQMMMQRQRKISVYNLSCYKSEGLYFRSLPERERHLWSSNEWSLQTSVGPIIAAVNRMRLRRDHNPYRGDTRTECTMGTYTIRYGKLGRYFGTYRYT